MNLEDFVVRKIMAKGFQVTDLTPWFCKIRNSEGKFQEHDWSDPYRRLRWQRWTWKIRYPVIHGGYQKCLRCGYVSRRLA